MSNNPTCPECGTEIAGETGIDPYRHGIDCLHIKTGPIDELINEYDNAGDEHGKRAAALLRLRQAPAPAPALAPVYPNL